MNDINIITPFSYEGLSATEATELQAVTARIKDRLTRQVSDIIDTGCDLIEVKSKLDHGQFENWLTQEFSMTTRTARRFMQAATWAEGKSDTVSVLTPTAIYLLSAPSTPESVAQTVFKSVESGEPAKPEAIRDLITEAKDRDRKAEHLKKEERARTKEEAGKKQREEQEHQKRRDLNDARGITKFLRDRLDTEDFNTFRRVIANYCTWRAFLEVTSDRYLVPPDGGAMKAVWEGGEAYIVPATKHAGFFFVAILLNCDDAAGDAGADVEGIRRPVRADGVAQYIATFGAAIPDGIEWETFPADPWEYNLYLGPHDPLATPSTAS